MGVDTPPQEREKSATIQPLEIPSASDDTLVMIPNRPLLLRGRVKRIFGAVVEFKQHRQRSRAELRRCATPENDSNTVSTERSPNLA